jgi:alpha-N-arabinofuranosidase
MFSTNQGDFYYGKVITKDDRDTTLAASCVKDSNSGDVILKMVNFSGKPKPMKVNLAGFSKLSVTGDMELLSGNPDAENGPATPNNVVPARSIIKVNKIFDYLSPAMSLTVIRIRKNN